jgi:hypothetical protein
VENGAEWIQHAALLELRDDKNEFNKPLSGAPNGEISARWQKSTKIHCIF